MGMIPGVVVTIPPDGHDDERRTIMPVINIKTLEEWDFYPAQVKFMRMKKNCWLGGEKGHWHVYPEMYMAFGEKIVFHLQNIDNPEQMMTVRLDPGQRLTIPPRIAHKVFALEGSILVGLTKEPYLNNSQDVSFTVSDNGVIYCYDESRQCLVESNFNNQLLC